MERRDFIKKTSLAAAAATITPVITKALPLHEANNPTNDSFSTPEELARSAFNDLRLIAQDVNPEWAGKFATNLHSNPDSRINIHEGDKVEIINNDGSVYASWVHKEFV